MSSIVVPQHGNVFKDHSCVSGDPISKILAFPVDRKDISKDSFMMGKCEVLWADNEVKNHSVNKIKQVWYTQWVHGRCLLKC